MAQTIFSGKTFDEQLLNCHRCEWQGKGADTIIIDLYGVADGKEVHCPQCDARLGVLKNEGDPPPESPNDLSLQIG